MVRILRAATWNFGYGSVGSPSKNNKTKVQKALEYLRKNNVDVVLAQEIFDPSELRCLYPNQIYSDIPVYNPQGQGLWGAMDFRSIRAITIAALNGERQYWLPRMSI